MTEKYPKVFSHIGYLECGEGWQNIIHGLAAIISNELDRIEDQEVVEEIYAVQIKEKFGSLRFYLNAGNDTIYGAVRMAEFISGYTCENCGNKGTMRSDGWIHTLCNECVKSK